MRWHLALTCLFLAQPAFAEVGAVLGIREVFLVGDTHEANGSGFAVAGIFMHELPGGFAVGSEPGVRSSGSDRYRLRDLVVPVVGRYTYAFAPTGRLRAILAVAGAVRISADRSEQTDDGTEWSHLRGVRGWDIDVIAGIGVEVAGPHLRYFVDLRHARGLVSIDAGETPVAIYRRELGVWIGASR